MAIDLFGASAKIWIRSGQGAQSLESLFGDSIAYIERVRVKINLLQLLEIEVTLAPPIEKAFQILRSGKLGVGFSIERTSGRKQSIDIESVATKSISVSTNSIAVQLYYGGLQSRIFEAILITPEISIGLEGISITLKGVGYLFSDTKRSSAKSYEGKNAQEVVKDLIGKDVDLEFEPDARERLSKVGYEFSNTRTNYEMALEILKQHDCFLFEAGKTKINDGKSKVIVRSYDYARKKNKGVPMFVAYRQIDPNAGIYPILGMNAAITNLLLPKGAFGQKQFFYNKETKELDELTTDAKEISKSSQGIPTGDKTTAGGAALGGITPGGGTTGFTGGDKDVIGGVTPGLKRGIKSTADIMRGVVHEYTSKIFEYDLETIGVVNMLPGQIVKVNIGDVEELSGSYDLRDVEHTLSTDGVVTNLTLLRTGGFLSSLSSGLQDVISSGLPSNVSSGLKTSSIKGLTS